MIKPLFSFILLVSAFSELHGKALADRLIMEIDHTPYSQRQLEIYFVVKDALTGKQNIRSTNTTNWHSLYEEFRVDMIIHQEALRLGSFNPSLNMLGKAEKIFNMHRVKQDIIIASMQRLGASQKTVKKVIATALRVESFRRSKERQASIRESQKSSSIVRTIRFSKWQKDLESRAVIRHFDGSDKFVPIAKSDV